MDIVRAATGWVVLGFLAFLGGTIVFLVATGRIALTKLVSEPNGDASMSRFQLLIFTFVVALCVLYVTLAPDSAGLPEVPTSVLTLLGISASSYAVGKSLQTQRDVNIEQAKKTGGVTAPPNALPSTLLEPKKDAT